MKLVHCIKNRFLPVLLVLAFVGCASRPVLIEHPERFFWEIKAKNASVYVQGTIHVADKSFYPLEEGVLTAFDTSDRLVSELGGEKEMAAFQAEMPKILLGHMDTDPKKNLLTLLSEEETAVLYAAIGQQAAQQLALFNPWVLNLTLTQLLLVKSGLDSTAGIDWYFMKRAGEKPITALESAEQQIAVLSHGTFDEQLLILKQTLANFQEADKDTAEIEKLRRFYLANDKQALAALLTETMKYPETFSQEKTQAFTDALFKDRNTQWVKKLHDYLQAGGKTFVFAGVGHFIGESNVFELMRKEKLLK